MKSRTLAVVMAALLVMGMTGASAYTTASADRDVSVNVVNDNNGIIQLQEGTVEGASITSGTLVVDADGESLNRDASFTFGNVDDRSSSHALNLTNQDDATRTFTLDSTGATSVTYYVAVDTQADGTVDSTQTVSPGGSGSFDLNSGGVAYVVVEVNTPDSTSDDSGTLGISAE